jgi:hypothetical protein
MKVDYNQFRQFLINELREKKLKNSRYSLRAFANFLAVDASNLSKIMRGIVKPSNIFIENSLEKLQANKHIKESLFHSLFTGTLSNLLLTEKKMSTNLKN